MAVRILAPLMCGAVLVLAMTGSSLAKHKVWHPCDPWGPWSESKSCKQVNLCFGSGHKRTVVQLTRTRECRNGMQQQNKQKAYCGCP